MLHFDVQYPTISAEKKDHPVKRAGSSWRKYTDTYTVHNVSTVRSNRCVAQKIIVGYR